MQAEGESHLLMLLTVKSVRVLQLLGNINTQRERERGHMTNRWWATWRERRGAGACMEGKCERSLKDRAAMRDALKVMSDLNFCLFTSFLLLL